MVAARFSGVCGSVSLDDLSSSLGASKAAIYYHFKRKQQILAAIVEPLLDAIDEVLVALRPLLTLERDCDHRDPLSPILGRTMQQFTGQD